MNEQSSDTELPINDCDISNEKIKSSVFLFLMISLLKLITKIYNNYLHTF